MSGQGAKACTKCGEVKPLNSFYALAASKDGRRSWCITCFTADGTERMKRRRANERWVHSIKNGRFRARENRLPCDDFSEAQMLEYWERHSIDPESSIYSGEPLEDDHHLDHLIPLSDPESPGHVLSNVVPSRSGENHLKSAHPLPVAVDIISKSRGVEAPFDSQFVRAEWSRSEGTK